MITPHILRFDSLPSTNLEAAREAADGASEGLCVIAAEQTAGRGRLERHWISPKGAGLYFSIVLRPQLRQSEWPLLTLMAAVAVHETLIDVFGLTADIKWPNDILANDKKLCGILAETVETRLGRAVVLGIGVNLRTGSFPAELQDVATSVQAATGQDADVEAFILPLAQALVSYYQTLQLPEGPERILREWSRRSSYAEGKRLRLVDGAAIIEGVSRGLGPDGALIIETNAGELKTFRSGDVTRLRPLEADGNEVHAQRDQK